MRKHVLWARDKYPELAESDGDYLEGLVDEAEGNVLPLFFIGVGILLAVVLKTTETLLALEGRLVYWALPLAYYPALKLFDPLQDKLTRRGIDSRVEALKS